MKKCLSFFTIVTVLATTALLEKNLTNKSELIADIPPVSINPPIKTQTLPVKKINIYMSLHQTAPYTQKYCNSTQRG